MHFDCSFCKKPFFSHKPLTVYHSDDVMISSRVCSHVCKDALNSVENKFKELSYKH